MSSTKPNRYLVVYQGFDDEELEYDVLAWTAEDALFQSSFLLPGSHSLYPIRSVEPWTSELVLRRQDQKLRKTRQEREFLAQESRDSLASQIEKIDFGSGME
jgi:hypothetical protein